MAKPVVLTEDQIQDLTLRAQLLAQIKTLQERELAIRNNLVASGIFSTLDTKREGSQTIHIAQYPGWTLTAKKVQYYNLTNTNNATRDAIELLREHEPAVADNIVSWKPSLAEGAFKKLPSNLQELFTAALTIAPGQCQLEINPPTEAFLKEQAEKAGTV